MRGFCVQHGMLDASRCRQVDGGAAYLSFSELPPLVLQCWTDFNPNLIQIRGLKRIDLFVFP